MFGSRDRWLRCAFAPNQAVVGVLIVLGTVVVGARGVSIADDPPSSVTVPASLASTVEASEPTEIAPPTMTAGHRRMLRFLKQIADGTPDENTLLGDADARALRKRISALSSDASN